MKEYIQGIFDNGNENVIRIFITNDIKTILHTPFASRCRRIIEFKTPTFDNVSQLICKIFDVTPKEALPLVEVVKQLEENRRKSYDKEIETVKA